MSWGGENDDVAFSGDEVDDWSDSTMSRRNGAQSIDLRISVMNDDDGTNDDDDDDDGALTVCPITCPLDRRSKNHHEMCRTLHPWCGCWHHWPWQGMALRSRSVCPDAAREWLGQRHRPTDSRTRGWRLASSGQCPPHIGIPWLKSWQYPPPMAGRQGICQPKQPGVPPSKVWDPYCCHFLSRTAACGAEMFSLPR